MLKIISSLSFSLILFSSMANAVCNVQDLRNALQGEFHYDVTVAIPHNNDVANAQIKNRIRQRATAMNDNNINCNLEVQGQHGQPSRCICRLGNNQYNQARTVRIEDRGHNQFRVIEANNI